MLVSYIGAGGALLPDTSALLCIFPHLKYMCALQWVHLSTIYFSSNCAFTGTSACAYMRDNRVKCKEICKKEKLISYKTIGMPKVSCEFKP